MQILCQIKKYTSHLKIPEILLMLWPTLIIFLPRYAIAILGLNVIWSVVNFIQKIKRGVLLANDLKETLHHTKKIFNGHNRLEFFLNLFFVVIGILDYWRPYETFDVEMKMTGLILCGIIWWYSSCYFLDVKKLRQAVNIGCIICAIVLIIDRILDYPWLHYIDRSVSQNYSILAMTFSLLLWVNIGFLNTMMKVLVSIGYCIFIYYFFDCDTAILGIILGLIAYGIGSIPWSWVLRFFQVKICLLILFLPFFLNYTLTDNSIDKINDKIHSISYIHRLHILKYCSDKISNRFWNGYGLNSSSKNDVCGVPYSFAFKSSQHDAPQIIKLEKLLEHPHNMIIQWWLEWGLIGALWWCGVMWALFDRIRFMPKESRSFGLAFFASNFTIVMFSINFWQSWWWATWMLLLPLLSQEKKTEKLCL